MRVGTGTEATPLYSLNLRPADLPDGFFINPKHRDRVRARRAGEVELPEPWQVVSVTSAGSAEVFCAVVPGPQAFALVDGILTGNCIMASEADLKTAARLAKQRPELLNDPHLYRKYVDLERSTGQVMLMPSPTKGRRTLEQVTGISI